MPRNLGPHSSPRRIAAALAGCLLAATATAACGGTAGPDEPGAPRATTVAPPATAAPTPSGSPPVRLATREADDPAVSLYAHLGGTLVVTDDNCVAVKSSTGGGTVVAVVWGHGWTVREEDGGPAVYDADGKLYAREGARVGLGGGTTDQYAGQPCVTGTQAFMANDAQAAASS